MRRNRLQRLCALVLAAGLLTACGGSVAYNTVEGTAYDREGFSASDIVTMSRILEDNILEQWYMSGVTPDNFDTVMEEELDASVIGIYRSGYRSWYSAIEDIGYTSPETLPSDISVTESVYYVNSDGVLVVEAHLQGTGEDAHEAVLEYQVDRNKIPTSIAVNVQRSLGEKMANAGLNTLLGMGMAFFVLILISLVISLLALFTGDARKNKKRTKRSDKPEGAVSGSEETSQAIDNTLAQITEREDTALEEEIAAVITAAVAAYETDAGTGGTVTRVMRLSDGATLLPQLPEVAPEDGVFIRPIRKREKSNWKKAI